jgi:hypothetical protein
MDRVKSDQPQMLLHEFTMIDDHVSKETKGEWYIYRSARHVRVELPTHLQISCIYFGLVMARNRLSHDG